MLAKESGYDLEQAKRAWGSVETVDVVDEETGATRYQLYLHPHGSGQLFRDGTTQSEG